VLRLLLGGGVRDDRSDSVWPIRLDRKNAVLWRGDKRVPLAPKPFEVLAVIAERPGELMTKDRLLTMVGGGVHVSESSLTVAMNALRAALGDDPAAPQFIETVRSAAIDSSHSASWVATAALARGPG